MSDYPNMVLTPEQEREAAKVLAEIMAKLMDEHPERAAEVLRAIAEDSLKTSR